MSSNNLDKRFAARGTVTAFATSPMMEPQIEQMIAYACDSVGDSSVALASMPMELARMAPGAPALQLALVLASAADATQGMFGPSSASGQRAQQLWKQAAMIGVDVHYLSLLGAPCATAGDLLEYWSQDPHKPDR